MYKKKLYSSSIFFKVFGSVIPPPSQKGNGIISQNQIKSQGEVEHPMLMRWGNG